MLSPNLLNDVLPHPLLSVTPTTQSVDVPTVCSKTLHRIGSSSIDMSEFAPGEFETEIDADQTTCVLAGSGTVNLTDGRLLQLVPGAALYLPRGLVARWIVRETLRTVAVRQANDCVNTI